MSEPTWAELLDLEWEAEVALIDADWVVESARIDLDGERTEEVNDGGQPDAAGEVE
jgi:hypothetical protein